MRHLRRVGGPPPGMPALDTWMKQLLGGLLGLYLVELLAAAAGVSTRALALHPIGLGFQPWQPVTRFLVQGGENVVSVLVSLVVLYFLLPALAVTLSRRQLIEGLGAAMLAGTLLPLLADVLRWADWLPFVPAVLYGWTVLWLPLICLFGLAAPDATVNLWFVLPIRSSWLVWGALAVSALRLLAAFGSGDSPMAPLEYLGLWGGTYAWWHLRGPPARRRTLQRKARDIERELRRFRVIPGGRDDTVH